MALQHLETINCVTVPDNEAVRIEASYDDVSTNIVFECFDETNTPIAKPAKLAVVSRMYNPGDQVAAFCSGSTQHVYVAQSPQTFYRHDTIFNSVDCGGDSEYLIEQFIVSNNDGSRFQVRVFYNTATFAVKTLAFRVNDDGSNGSSVIPPVTLAGVVTDRTTAVGNSVWTVCDNTTLHNYIAKNEYPYAADQVTLNSPTCMANNPACDLFLLQATPSQESAEGSGDGQIVISASTSHGPAQYRINGGAYQADNVFRNLSAGSYLVEVTDALNCYRAATVVLSPQKDTLKLNPERSVSLLNKSRWSAVFNPIVFLYQRKDAAVLTVVADNLQQVTVVINDELSSAEIAAVMLSYVYVKTEKYEFTMAPDSAISAAPGTTTIIFKGMSIGAAGNDAGGYANLLGLKRGYRFLTEVTSGFSILKTVQARHSPDAQGIARADISTFLKPVLKPVDNFKYNLINWRDENLGGSYTIRYREEWDNGAGEWIYIDAPYYMTYSALQIGAKYGSNMGEYVPFPNEPDLTKKAKFMNEYVMPTYTLGLPFDLTFIYSEKIVGYNVKLREIPLDINGVPIEGVAADTFLLNEDSSFILNEDSSKLVIQRANVAVGAALYLLDHLGVNRLKLSGLYPALTHFVDVYLYILNEDLTETRITEIKRVKIVQKKPCNYQLLKWIGPQGGWNYALFDFKTERTIDISEVQTIDRFVADYETEDGNVDVVSKAAVKKTTVGKDNVSIQEANAIATLMYSPKVYLLINEVPLKWQTVLIDTKGGQLFDTKSDLGDIELTYKHPEINTQKQ